MIARHSPLLAVFLVSGLSTWAGIAAASGDDEAHASERFAAPAPVPDSLRALVDGEPADAGSRAAADWSAEIDARLADLAARRRHGAEPREQRDRRLESHLRGHLRDQLGGQIGDARVAVEVRELDDPTGPGAVVASLGGERVLNPASNQKLITAIAAVELLGPDYRFATTVDRAGDRLILRGEGDPDLQVADLHRLAAEVIASGAHEGVTAIVLDERAFDGQRFGPGFRADGPGDSYVAPSAPLAIAYATVEISVRPGAWGAPAEVSVEPSGAAFEIRNRASTGTGALRVETIAGEHGRTVIEVDGAIAAGHAPVTVRRRVYDPGLVAAASFAELLAAQTGAAPLPVVREPLPELRERVASHESAPLIAVLGSALRYSNNFTAEQVLRTLAWRASGEPGSWAAGAAVLDRFAAAVSPVAREQLFVNGSGLSRDGRLSPRFVNDVLALTVRPGSPAQVLLASFAAAGGEGTLHYRLASAGPRVLAKTGTYAGASSLSGLVTAADGRLLGFSILINGGELERNRELQDRIVATLLR